MKSQAVEQQLDLFMLGVEHDPTPSPKPIARARHKARVVIVLERYISAEQYIEQSRTDPITIARAAAALPVRAQLDLAVRISALKQWHEPGACYNFWLNLWAKV